MGYLAKDMLESAPALLEEGKIQWKKFEDGFPNLFIENVAGIRGRDVLFLASFLNQAEMFAQLSIIYSLPRYGAKSLTILLPYFPTGTMERVDQEGQVATAHTLARMLSNVPPTTSGPAKIVIYDIHALQERFYFGDSVIPWLASGVPLFLDQLKTHHNHEKVVIAFPDEGAQKRFGGMFSGYPLVVCTKIRDGDKRIVTIKEGAEHLDGAHVFIVDDLVKTGGTLIECRHALMAKGAAKCSAYVTHAVFPVESWQRFVKPVKVPESDTPQVVFSVFYVTNSCEETVMTIQDKFALSEDAEVVFDWENPFRELSLAESLIDEIKKVLA